MQLWLFFFSEMRFYFHLLCICKKHYRVVCNLETQSKFSLVFHVENDCFRWFRPFLLFDRNCIFGFRFFFIFNWKCTSFPPKTIFQRRPSLTSAIRSNLSPTVTFVVKAVSKPRFLATAINVSIMSENALYMWTAGAKQTDFYCLLVSVQTKISPVLLQLLKCSLI